MPDKVPGEEDQVWSLPSPKETRRRARPLVPHRSRSISGAPAPRSPRLSLLPGGRPRPAQSALLCTGAALACPRPPLGSHRPPPPPLGTPFRGNPRGVRATNHRRAAPHTRGGAGHSPSLSPEGAPPAALRVQPSRSRLRSGRRGARGLAGCRVRGAALGPGPLPARTLFAAPRRQLRALRSPATAAASRAPPTFGPAHRTPRPPRATPRATPHTAGSSEALCSAPSHPPLGPAPAPGLARWRWPPTAPRGCGSR